MNLFKNSLPSLALLLFAASALAAAAPPLREHILFTDGWRFQKDDPAGTGNALAYRTLKPWLLPTANAFLTTPAAPRPEGPFDQNLPGETAKLPWSGVAWYRKTFDLPASDRGRRIALEIDGAKPDATGPITLNASSNGLASGATTIQATP